MGPKIDKEPYILRPCESKTINQMTSRILKSKAEIMKKLEEESSKDTLFDYVDKMSKTRNKVANQTFTTNVPTKISYNKFINKKPLKRPLIDATKTFARKLPNKNKNLRQSVIHSKKEEYTNRVHFDKISVLPYIVFTNIITYVMNDFRHIICVSPSWYNAAVDAFTEFFNPTENKFVSTYSQHFVFHDSYLSSTCIRFGGKMGYRIDRIICFEVQRSLINKYITIGFTYSFCGEEDIPRRIAIYKFEVIESGKPKISWIHRNKLEDSECQAYSVPTPQVSTGDIIEISINFSNLSGLINVDTIQWRKILIQDIPSENALNYNKDNLLKNTPHIYTKSVADLSRICEAEDAEIDWVDHLYLQKEYRSKLFNIELLQDMFIVKRILCSGADIIISKYYLIAKSVGTLDKKVFGIPLRIVEDKTRCRVEVKMCGLLIDRAIPIELNIGDLLIFYFSCDSQKSIQV